ncbi:MAG: hypothetical protein HY537_13490 [Deltaproteobacteria bacterium]|nr:hypothetical protein [Deltaproteobacteria bacterium]
MNKELREWSWLLLAFIPIVVGVWVLIPWIVHQLFGWSFDNSMDIFGDIVGVVVAFGLLLTLFRPTFRCGLLVGMVFILFAMQQSVGFAVKHIDALRKFERNELEIVLVVVAPLLILYFLVWRHQTNHPKLPVHD